MGGHRMKNPFSLIRLSKYDDKTLQQENKRIWATFFHLIRKSKLPYVWIVVTFLLGLFSSQLTLMFPDYTQKIIGGDISSGTIGQFIFIIILNGGVAVFISVISGVTIAKITKGVRITMWEDITHIPIHVIEKENAKELISRTTEDTTALSTLLASTIPDFLANIYLVAGSILAVSSYHSSLMFSLIVLMLVQLLLTRILGKINFKYSNIVQLKLARLTEIVSEILANIPLVKIFVTEKKEQERGERYVKDYYDTYLRYQTVSTIAMESSQIINIIGSLTVIIIGIILVSSKQIDIGQWIAYFMYYQTLTQSIILIPDNWKYIKAAQGTTRRIAEVSCIEKENYETGIAFEETEKSIILEDIQFAYENDKVLDGLSLEIPYGKTTALVGESGAGKTTLLALLERFYSPISGIIRYGDRDIMEYKLKDWRGALGYLSQEAMLFGGTVYDNITYGMNSKISMETVREACQEADALEFIERLDEGFETDIGEFGNRLSGGQKQKLCIARTILLKPSIFLLDEFNSNLDLDTENNVRQALDRLCRGKTRIVVAHRLATIKGADHIAVIKDGRVEAVGKHEELLKISETYQDLIHKQAFV